MAPWLSIAALTSAALAKVHRRNEEFGKLSRSGWLTAARPTDAHILASGGKVTSIQGRR
jgi:hypothetical protein